MKNMKKLISMMLAFSVTASLAAAETAGTGTADTGDTETGLVGMANPWTEYDSLEDLNAAAGTNLCLPGVMGVTGISCRLLETGEGMLAELTFQVNGMSYTLRGSCEMTDDISGVWLSDGKTAFEGVEDAPAYVTTDTLKLARWVDVNAQYVLMAEDNGEMDEETFQSIAEEMMDLTNPYDAGALTEGTYWDSVSQRASAEVTYNGDGVYAVEIHWADSATVDNVWTMTATLLEDGTMTYADCIKKRVTTADDGTSTFDEANLIPDGSFMMISPTSFDWSGAAEEFCRACVFEMAED